MMRVTIPGSALTVSFHPASLGSGGMAAAVYLSCVIVQISENIKRAAIENLETNQVEMNRVRIVGKIDEAPDFDGIERGFSVTGSCQ